MSEMISEGLKFDLVLTDPPYNLKKDFGNDSDDLPLDEFINATTNRLSLIKKLLSDNGSLIWFGIHNYIGFIQMAMHSVGLYYRRMNIWHYNNGFSRSKRYPKAEYEPFLWYSNSNNDWHYNADIVRIPYISTKRLANPVYYYSSNGERKKWVPDPRGRLRGDVWEYPTLAGNLYKSERTEHPTQKPESLFTDLLRAFMPMTKDGLIFGRVLDPFHGSGTMGVCAEKLNAIGHHIEWYGIELERKWIDVANKRINKISEGNSV